MRRGVRDGRLGRAPPCRPAASWPGSSASRAGWWSRPTPSSPPRGSSSPAAAAGTAVAPRPPAGPGASGVPARPRSRRRAARRPTTCARAAPTSRPSRARRGRRRWPGPCGRSPTPASTTATRAAPRRCGPRWPTHLGRARGVAAAPGDVVVTTGVTQGLALVLGGAARARRPPRRRRGPGLAQPAPHGRSTPGWRPCRCPSTPTGSTSTPCSRWTRPSTPSR